MFSPSGPDVANTLDVPQWTTLDSPADEARIQDEGHEVWDEEWQTHAKCSLLEASTLLNDGSATITPIAKLALRRAPGRTPSIPEFQWEQQRSTITRLYLEQGMKLKDVMAFMAEEFDFHATVQMYKKHFHAWDVQKNNTRDQKEAVITQLECHQLFEGTPSPTLGNSRPVPYYKIKRYQRQQSRQTIRGSHAQCRPIVSRRLSPAKRATSPQSLISHRIVTSVPNPVTFLLHQSTESRSFEAALHCTKEYCHWVFQQGYDTFTFGIKIINELIIARDLLVENSRRAFSILQRACDHLQEMVQHQLSLDLLEILSELRDPSWDKHSAIKQQMLRFLNSLVTKTQGQHHPASLLLTSLTANSACDYPNNRVIRLGLELAPRYFDRRSPRFYELQISFALSLINNEDFDLAERLCEQILHSTESSSSQDQYYKCYVLYMLGSMFYFQRRNDEARALAVDALEICRHWSYKWDFGYLSVVLSGLVALTYQNDGNLLQSEQFYREAVKHSISIGNRYDIVTLRYLDGLRRILEFQGKDEELRQLWIDYGHVWEYWDKWVAS